MANFPVIFPTNKLSHALGIRKQRSDPLGQPSQDPETLESERVLLSRLLGAYHVLSPLTSCKGCQSVARDLCSKSLLSQPCC